MSKRPASIAAALLLCFCVGVVLKGIRYAADADIKAATPELALSGFMAQFGWQPMPIAPGSGDAAIEVRRYAKKGCARAVDVAIMGRSDGLASLLRLAYGDDLAFIQNGRVVAKPNMLRSQFTRAVGIFAAFVGPASGRVVPIIAVAPAPGRQGGRCLPPPIKTWQQLRLV